MGSSHCKTKRVQNLRGIVYSDWKAAAEAIRRIPSRDKIPQPPSSAGRDACGLQARNRHWSSVRSAHNPLRTSQVTRSQTSEEINYVTEWARETTAVMGNRRKTLMRGLFANPRIGESGTPGALNSLIKKVGKPTLPDGRGSASACGRAPAVSEPRASTSGVFWKPANLRAFARHSSPVAAEEIRWVWRKRIPVCHGSAAE